MKGQGFLSQKSPLSSLLHIRAIWFKKWLVGFLSMASDSIAEVVAAWKEDPSLCKQAAGVVLAVVGKDREITRKEVCTNSKVLEPIVKHLGA